MKIFIALAIVVVLAAGCSKKDSSAPVTPPPVVVLPDTLGVGWSKITVSGARGFSDIFFANADTGYALSGNLWKSTDGGSNWQNTYNIVGENLFVTPRGSIFVTSASNQTTVLRSVDGGLNFASTNISLTAARLFDLCFTGNDTGYLPAGRNNLFRTTDAGNTWAAIPAVTGLNTNAGTGLIPFFINSSTGWISDGSNIFKTNGSATSWTTCNFTSDHPSGSYITLYAPNASTVYAAASVDNGHTAIYKSTNGGTDFSLLKKFDLTGQGYSDIHFLDNNNGYVCAGKRMYKTTDGGTTWTSVVALGNTTIVEIHFTDSNHGWACCSDSTILKFRQ